ncbi:MAG TPA: ATP synthase subunit I [Gammaproteobacteria bacterium]|nr:ATP synthase subunit I [Gammaproteobacteria bacterium]
MGKVVLPATRKRIYRGVSFSLGTIAVISFLAFFFQQQIGYSILLGGVLWFLPECYVVYRLFHRIEMEPRRAVMTFYQSEIVKLLLVALLFILVVKEVPVNFIGLIAGYFTAQILFFVKGVY